MRLIQRGLILAIKGYQLTISRVIPPVCRFTPSCSQYMIDAIEKKGLAWGILKGIGRVLRCNPYFPGGHDPVQ